MVGESRLRAGAGGPSRHEGVIVELRKPHRCILWLVWLAKGARMADHLGWDLFRWAEQGTLDVKFCLIV